MERQNIRRDVRLRLLGYSFVAPVTPRHALLRRLVIYFKCTIDVPYFDFPVSSLSSDLDCCQEELFLTGKI